MTLDQLETFLYVARARSFSRAAVLLDLAQPTLSGRISALEGELGISLFARHGHTLEVTEAGRVLLPYAERMLALRTEGMHAIQRLKFGGLGRLTLGANPTCSQYLVPRLIEMFNQAYPDAPIWVRTALTPSLMENLLDGVVQLALCSQAQIAPQARVLWHYSDPLLVVTARHHPLARRASCTRADLAGYPVLSTQAGPTRLGLRLLLPPDGESAVAIEATAGEVLTQLVRHGVGITVLPALAVWEELARGELISLPVSDVELPTYEVALVQWEERPLSAAAQAFADLVKATPVASLRTRESA